MNEIAAGEGGLMPASVQDKLAMAELLVKSGLLPKGLDTKEKVFVALQWGDELGLRPMAALTNISVVNGRPILSANIMTAIVSSHKEYAGMRWRVQDSNAAEVIIKRRRGTVVEEFTGYFSIQMAKQAGLLSKENWVKYPGRMLKHRALSFACRDAFPDVLSGVYEDEEAGEIEPENKNVPPQEVVQDGAQPLEKEGFQEAAEIEEGQNLNGFDFEAERETLLASMGKMALNLSEHRRSYYREKLKVINSCKDCETRFSKTLELASEMNEEVEQEKDLSQPEIF